MSYLISNLQKKTFTGILQNISITIPYTLWTYNLQPGKTYRISYNIATTYLTPSGNQDWRFICYDSGNTIPSLSLINIEYGVSQPGFSPGPVMFISSIITMDPAGTGVFECKWTTASGANSSMFVQSDGYNPMSEITVEEIVANQTAAW